MIIMIMWKRRHSQKLALIPDNGVDSWGWGAEKEIETHDRRGAP